MKNRWLVVIVLAPAIGACSDANWANKLSSDSVSQEQIETISNNIEKLYPDANDELKYKAADVAVRAIENLVFVEGGSFEMGDFGAPCEIPSGTVHRMDWSPDAECLSSPTSVETGAANLHKVTLDSYSISAYLTSFIDMEWMRKINNLPVAADKYHDSELIESGRISRSSSDYKHLLDVRSDQVARAKEWQEAKDYCLWIGDITGLSFDLPTETQWEYAARSRGKNYYFSTNNGYLQLSEGQYFDPKSGYYISYEEDEVNARNFGERTFIGQYPPNPLGIYGMTNQTSEWINDWYSPDYYSNSPEHNPQGPKTGTKKVMRDGAGTTMTFSRLYAKPILDQYFIVSYRCAL
ncbi:formylglycine-generating enzyme family protein [Vibrio sp. ZSDE26]|uniref:Formylglycine-generating enzyme family protein n=1 Tax=Vibrio amylolyticus TaxID=2847292 RepID=A0A9X1XUK0_9VIBR|nr:SUMF1/EgtB/PvdO family nonheme iron enzyme [Vibrio amylolyticus]MCK6265869.1 formylglycine-generating enzyme family protein [Vibrio amylolyticus]